MMQTPMRRSASRSRFFIAADEDDETGGSIGLCLSEASSTASPYHSDYSGASEAAAPARPLCYHGDTEDAGPRGGGAELLRKSHRRKRRRRRKGSSVWEPPAMPLPLPRPAPLRAAGRPVASDLA